MMLNSDLVRANFTYDDGQLIWNKNPEKSNAWNGKFAGKPAGSIRPDGRIVIRFAGKLWLRYHLVWLIHFEALPTEIDHIDRDVSNDRIENLRAADRYINNGNTSAKGVVCVKGRYIARIMHNGIQYHLGSFDTFELARAAYLAKRYELRGF